MSDTEIIAEYKYLPARVGFWATMSLVPGWGIFAPFFVAIVVFMLLLEPGSMLSSSSFGGGLGLAGAVIGMLLTTLVGVLLTVFWADNKIRITRDGLRIPAPVHLFSRFPRDTTWQDVRSVRVAGVSDGAPSKLFVATGRRKLSVNLKGLKKDDVERLMLSIDLWAPVDSKSDSFQRFLETFENRSGGAIPSFTQMWEEELQQRFSATSFVPLEPDAQLRGGELRVLRQLSFGGLSAIYLVQARKRDLFVLKELVIPSDAKDEIKAKALELFQREAETLVRMNHPGIVKVFDHFVEQGRHYMLLEYLQGTNLRQLVIEQGPQSEAEVLRWALGLCELLVYFENLTPPLIHRDLTPDNIVMKPDRSLILIDFGAANEFIGKSTGTLVGKQCYMAPEQFRGKAVPASDIYSLGGTVHYLLTGQDPEPLCSMSPAEVKPGLQGATDALVRKCTAMELSQRYPSAVALKEALEDALKEFV